MSIFKPPKTSLPESHQKDRIFHIEEDLRHAAYTGDLDTIKQLQIHYPKLDINAPNEHGETALYLACKRGEDGVVDYLLAQPKVDIEAATILGCRPLLIAAWNNNNPIAETLVSKGAHIKAETLANRKYHGGVSALDIAEERGNTELAKFLIEALDTPSQQM